MGFCSLALIIVTFVVSYAVGDLNLRPIIGVLTQTPPDDILELLPDNNYTSFVDACYIKYIEGAGARVVPIFIDQEDSYYESIASSVNGILFPGGDVSVTNSSGYGAAGQKLYEHAVNSYKEGIHLPVWGTCLGQEMIMYLAANQTDWLSNCKAENKADPLTLQSGYDHSRIFSVMPERIEEFLTLANTTINFHAKCTTPEDFITSGVSETFMMLATSFDNEDLEYVALVEHKEMPIFGSQFHPEMVPFQWPQDPRHNNIPHDLAAVEVSQYLANFFVSQARLNNQSFVTLEEEEEALIYNYDKIFTGYPGIIYTEVYLFN